MSKPYKKRSLIDFQKDFTTEEAGKRHLAEQRWALGFACPKCSHNQFWLLGKRGLFDCKQCRHQTSVTAGTIFHKTRTSLVKWYWLLYRMAMDKAGVSIAEMQRILEIGSYKTA